MFKKISIVLLVFTCMHGIQSMEISECIADIYISDESELPSFNSLSTSDSEYEADSESSDTMEIKCYKEVSVAHIDTLFDAQGVPKNNQEDVIIYISEKQISYNCPLYVPLECCFERINEVSDDELKKYFYNYIPFGISKRLVESNNKVVVPLGENPKKYHKEQVLQVIWDPETSKSFCITYKKDKLLVVEWDAYQQRKEVEFSSSNLGIYGEKLVRIIGNPIFFSDNRCCITLKTRCNNEERYYLYTFLKEPFLFKDQYRITSEQAQAEYMGEDDFFTYFVTSEPQLTFLLYRKNQNNLLFSYALPYARKKNKASAHHIDGFGTFKDLVKTSLGIQGLFHDKNNDGQIVETSLNIFPIMIVSDITKRYNFMLIEKIVFDYILSLDHHVEHRLTSLESQILLRMFKILYDNYQAMYLITFLKSLNLAMPSSYN